MSAFKTLALAMAKGFVRDKMALFFAIVFPIMFLLLFGGLLNDQGTSKSEVVQIENVVVLDQALKAALATLDISKESRETRALEDLRKGNVDAVVSQTGDTLILHYSQADAVRSSIVRGTMGAIVQSANAAASSTPDTYTLKATQVEDQALETIQYVTPGLLGWAIAMGATLGAAANLVVWRTNGLLRRLRLAPIPTASIVGARVLVSLGVAATQTIVFLGLAIVLFGLKLTGSWPMIIPLLIAATLAFMSIGLLAGAISKTEEGATGLANFVILPMAFLSGSFFPLDDAPTWLKTISNLLPLKHLNEGMLDTMVRGQGPSAAVWPIVILLGFAVVLTAVSAKVFRWDK
ncbi:ABC transporter permease [soil metagenome]